MKGLLTAPLRSGVYDMVDDAALPDRLRRTGWHVGVVDLGDARQAVAAIGAELGFPDYYGKNLDALNDCLSDIERPTALLVHVPAELGHYGQTMLEVLTERAESVREVPFALVRLPGSTSP
jgi:RNAse (barnase) inhibitor barstar